MSKPENTDLHSKANQQLRGSENSFATLSENKQLEENDRNLQATRDDDEPSLYPTAAPSNFPSNSPTLGTITAAPTHDAYVEWGCDSEQFINDCVARNIESSSVDIVNPSDIIFALDCVQNRTDSNSTYGSGAFVDEVLQSAFCGKNNSYDIICHNGTVYDNNFQAEPLCPVNSTFITHQTAGDDRSNWLEEHPIETTAIAGSLVIVGAAIAWLCCRKNSDRVTDFRGL